MPSHLFKAISSIAPVFRVALQRKCACGGPPGPTGECDQCSKKRGGNRLQRFPTAQELAINKPGDKYEKEADRVAEQVMRTTEPQPTCTGGDGYPKCATEWSGQEQERLQPRRVGSGDLGEAAVPPIVHEVLRSPGQRLDPATRALMEPRFGHDFAKVRVHANNRAAESAEAVNALAYTVGDQIVFGAGQHVPGNSRGQRLLAHELVHVVQQNGAQTLPGKVAGRDNISRAPVGVVSRKASAQDEEQQKKAVARHREQQRRAADLLDKARKIQADPKKGLRDPANLFHNTVEMLDAGKFTLTILSATHYSRDRHFNSEYKYPKIGGDYPADPKVGGPGMVWEPNPPAGKIFIPPSSSTTPIRTLPEKTERAPGVSGPTPGKTDPGPAKTSGQPPAPRPFSPSDVYLFTRGFDITEDDFKNTFVHEAQHVADLSPKVLYASSASELLEAYKSEFRAFWIQPPVPPVGQMGQQSIDRLPEPIGKADNSQRVTIADPQRCTMCPAPDPSAKAGKSAFAEPKTDMKNPRQKEIFWHILSQYKDQQYDCCYVHNEKFHQEVNQFAYPQSVNLINSARVMNLNLELRKLRPAMTKDDVVKTNFFNALQNLDALDWAFLKDKTYSKPFWDALQAQAPKFLADDMKTLVKKATTQGLDVKEIDKLRPQPPPTVRP